MKYRLGLAAVLTAIALPALAAGADPVVATVNGKEIHRSTLVEMQQSIAQLRQVPLEMVYDQLLDHVITGQLLLEQAKKLNLESDPEVKAQVKEAQQQILQQAYLKRRVDADITEDQIKRQFEEMKKTQPPKEEVKARHILVNSEDEAKAVIADLKAGTAFEEEAKAKTIDPSGKSNGGDLGYIGKEETVPEFSEAAFKLKNGEFTQTPVKTQFGWHVIRVEDRRTAPPPSYEQAKPQIKNQLAQQDLQKVIEGLQKSAQISRFKADGSPASEKVKP
ncbi:MAG TPA: parvulin peptidyl-prolyl isomerase [Rhodospirillaceae bacterium]|nr:parvulin peptidyl-prolyl isomerase [Rhodospirillaceae bacterium]